MNSHSLMDNLRYHLFEIQLKEGITIKDLAQQLNISRQSLYHFKFGGSLKAQNAARVMKFIEQRGYRF